MRAHGRPVSHPQLTLPVRLHTTACRPLRALHALRRFRHEFDVQPQVHACNRVLGALAAAGHVEDALKLFDEMSEGGVQPIPVTFAIMVRALAHAGMVDRLLEMIGRMQNEVCRLMLQHHDEGKLDTKSKSPEKVINVVYEMIEVGCSMEEIVYSAIIYGFYKYASSTEAKQNFEIDEESEEYLELHPQAATKDPRLTEEHFYSLSEDDPFAIN
ncbi:Pentatricopeptide repeat-containing protein [Zea mays]|uniref:Pentatricopeptide repeat-containing protein n=1 Tax=Zea mays TaxID=4577 RepID=A0A1D6P899_MAIZE|nr:Pentatricopeptide repeat-containing protein [Zea mays]